MPVLVNQNDFPVGLFLLWTPSGIRTISGKVITTDCGDPKQCKTTPVPGVTVTAKGLKGGGKAITDAKGKYAIDVPRGNYTVTPSFRGDKFTPPAREKVAVSGDVSGIDFRAKSPCDDPSSSRTAQAASAANPCQRLYTIKVGAWIPYTSVTDPAVGANLQNGTDYPEDAKSIAATLTGGLLASDAYPPCLPVQTLKLFQETRPDLSWRARFLGSGQRLPVDPGLGFVTVPIAWNGSKHEASFRLPSVRAGRLQRQYDYQLGPSRGSCQQPVTRAVTPTLRTQLTGGGDGFVIDISYPVPFQPYEDLGDIQDFADATIGALTKPAAAALEAKLEAIPVYKALPGPVKTKVKAWAESFAARAGAAAAISLVKDALKSGKSFLADRTPPPIKIGKKAIEILKKLAYGSADIRITGKFETKEGIPGILAGSTRLTITTASDAFPSFSLTVARPQGVLPWNGNESVNVKKNFGGAYDSLPNVVSDAVTETGVESILQGGPGKLLITGGLATITNATPKAVRAFLPPLLVGGDKNAHTITWTFPGANS